jgi:hypothetical protein
VERKKRENRIGLSLYGAEPAAMNTGRDEYYVLDEVSACFPLLRCRIEGQVVEI